MNNPTFFEVQKWAFSCIKGNGGTLEDVDYLICGQMGWNKTQLLMNYRTRIDDKNYQELQEKIELYNQDYPLQYLIGYQDFYGLRLKVTKDTLIPSRQSAITAAQMHGPKTFLSCSHSGEFRVSTTAAR